MSTTPVITFMVNLTLATGEVIGPSPDAKSQEVLPPDRYTGANLQDSAVASIAFRATLRSVYLPGLSAGDNVYRTHGDVFTAIGEDALYLKNTYGIGFADPQNACLVVVSQVN
jgi:hypothetical protein